MNAPLVLSLFTTDQLLAMPEDGVDRDLIRGQLWEKPMTRRNPQHSGSEANLANLLVNWLKQQPKPRGRVLAGEAGCRLRRDPDTTVGIDVAFINADLAARTPKGSKLVDGLPILAVEILSPEDKLEEISAKIQEYLEVGIPLVWVVDPDFGTVCVYRPAKEPELFNLRQELTGEPELPGFRVAVAEIFDF